jgi:hypothetical protein
LGDVLKLPARLLLLLSCAASCFATSGLASDTPDLSAHVPEGWKLLQQQHGDLNADGRDDAVLVLEKDDPANRQSHAGLGADNLNLNPRRLLILFQAEGNYQVVLSADRFLPSENDEKSPCLADPLADGELEIVRNTLRIRLNYWLSCGGWGTSSDTYIFRFQEARFRLIGRDHRAYMRNSGEASEYSVNYLTGAVKVTTCLNEFEPARPKTAWKRTGSLAPLYLDALAPDDVPDEGGE